MSGILTGVALTAAHDLATATVVGNEIAFSLSTCRAAYRTLGVQDRTAAVVALVIAARRICAGRYQ